MECRMGVVRGLSLVAIGLGLLGGCANTGLVDPIEPAESVRVGESMTDAQVAAFARLALAGIGTEYPNKPSQVMVGPESVLSPRELHPAFYGSFDWHSSVHGHWMLLRLLRLYPQSSVADEIGAALAEHLAADVLEAEAEHFRQEHNKSFERMYGWAWLYRLAMELEAWDDPRGDEWGENLRPLREVIVGRTKDYLPNLSWPIRTGVHPNSAFALGQTLDFARLMGDRELEQLVIQKSHEFYIADRAYPVAYEPSGQDFFSAGLAEADLMRRVLDAGAFGEWLDQFFPTLGSGELGNLLMPAVVSDVTDGKIVHLAGLNLHRAWTMRSIAAVLPEGDARRKVLEASAEAHMEAGLAYVFSGHYEGEHWLATFAVYGLTDVDGGS